MGTAEMVLEYVRALEWPVLASVWLLVFRHHVVRLLCRLRRAEWPGGAADFADELERGKELQAQARREAERQASPRQAGEQSVSEPTSPALASPVTPQETAAWLVNQRLLHLGLSPSPSGLDFDYYRHLALRDPSLALAGLRIELEQMGRNVAAGYGVPVDTGPGPGGMMRIARRLAQANAITPTQEELATTIAGMCNRAVHGERVSLQDALEVIDLADLLRDYFVAWLGWGFADGWALPASARSTKGA